MAEQAIMLTKAGLAKLRAELDELKGTRRKQVAERLKEAIALGDLSENSEYDDAKNEQAFIEGRIKELEVKLRHVEIISAPRNPARGAAVVAVGSRVSVRDLEAGEDMEYELVGSAEADPTLGRISNESPLGLAILGCRAGSVVEVSAPMGSYRYKVLRIGK